MVNYLRTVFNIQFKYHAYFEVIRDFRKGGLTPNNYDSFISEIDALPKQDMPKVSKLLEIGAKYGLSNITEEDFTAIMREVQKRAKMLSKKCWHPDASKEKCHTDPAGNIIISAAHSIQNNGILKKIAKNGHVKTYEIDGGEFDGKLVSKNVASTFYGFCNRHDAIFRPIEVDPYVGSTEQHFLFAYRGFVVSMHAKEATSYYMNYGDQALNDIAENKKIFDDIITNKSFDQVVTHEYRLNAHYPIAASSAFYLEMDFNGTEIKHSDKRMEFVFVTLYPEERETIFLLSYFRQDEQLYRGLADQLFLRQNLKSDISILLAPNVENIFFEPSYFDTFIPQQNDILLQAFREAAYQIVKLDEENQISEETSLTPPNFLSNQLKVNLFGY